MITKPIKRPRRIDPSLIDLGDDISVEHKPVKGVTMTLRGIVAMRGLGSTRYLATAEGATLLAWEPGKTSRVKVTLYGRAEPEQATLFDVLDSMDEVRARIA